MTEDVDVPDENDLWDFSLQLYGRPGVEPACLRLQDSVGLDVNMLLLCCWLGTKGVMLPQAGFETLEGRIRDWRRNVVEPLRAVRRYLKNAGEEAADGFREEVKHLELEAERLEQDVLFRELEVLPGKDGREADLGGLIRSNLVRYAASRGKTPDKGMRADFEMLVDQAFDIL